MLKTIINDIIDNKALITNITYHRALLVLYLSNGLIIQHSTLKLNNTECQILLNTIKKELDLKMTIKGV